VSNFFLCCDALDAWVDTVLTGKKRTGMVFTDPPYNVPILGHVCTNADSAHREFATGVGEMTAAALRGFLAASLAGCRAVCMEGAIVVACMDLRRIEELIVAAKGEKFRPVNLCV
jgi:hypothetical protein